MRGFAADGRRASEPNGFMQISLPSHGIPGAPTLSAGDRQVWWRRKLEADAMLDDFQALHINRVIDIT